MDEESVNFEESYLVYIIIDSFNPMDDQEVIPQAERPTSNSQN